MLASNGNLYGNSRSVANSTHNNGRQKRALAPSVLDKNKTGLLGIFWKCARIGERKSPYVAICCVVMAFSILFMQ
ncbi:hypothetical protein chiPu_0003938 [Chiloscyllium punctatum]|uniref:Uncharacterized protein n=1 Tax=Chiloscyllium punctatum TaxID=137246 RepID=A0A401S559_CHIPU|nr:hypothetical protein [Chiloscyllium punctatum]